MPLAQALQDSGLQAVPTLQHAALPGMSANAYKDSGFSVFNSSAFDAKTMEFDYYSHRMFFDGKYEKPSVLVRNGQWTIEKGERKPIRVAVPILDLLNKGITGPGGMYITANATSLRKEDWIQMDREIIKVARPVLKAWTDLAAANSIGGFSAMRRMTYEYEAMSDPGIALVDMDAMTEGRTDSPLFKLRSIPLPITHGDFWFSERRLEVSRNSTALDTTMAEAVSRRIAETVEATTIGTQAGINYGKQTAGYGTHDTGSPDDGHGSALGGSTVYGYTNYPHRLTKTNFTDPSLANWTADTTNNEVLAAVQQLLNQNFTGPFMLYHSRDWSQYMNRQFSVSGGNNPGETLRGMLLKNPDIIDVRRLDWLTSTYTLIFVQMTKDVAAAINGMGITTLNWPSIGGMRQNFKIMCINVPLIRSDYKGQCGILHGTTA